MKAPNSTQKTKAFRFLFCLLALSAAFESTSFGQTADTSSASTTTTAAAKPAATSDEESPSAWTDSKIGKIDTFLLGGLNYQLGGEKYSVPFFGLKLNAPVDLPLEHWKMFSSGELIYSALPTRQDRVETTAGIKDVFSLGLSTTIFNTDAKLGVSLGYSLDQSANSLLMGTMPEIGVGHRYTDGHIEARIFNSNFEDRNQKGSDDTTGITGKLTGVCVIDEHQVSDLVTLRTTLKAGWLNRMDAGSTPANTVDVNANEGGDGSYVKLCMAPVIGVSKRASIGLAGIYEGYSYSSKRLVNGASTTNLSLKLFGEVSF